jgi:hypothetical protein
MLNWNPFSKLFHVRCKDGSVKNFYKNIDHAFPLVVSGVDLKFTAKMRSDIIKDVTLDATSKEEIKSLLYQIDDLNNNNMIAFRAAYIGFQSDPCANSEYLLKEIKKINDEAQRLSGIKLQIRGYIDIVRNNPKNKDKTTKIYFGLIKEMQISIKDNSIIQHEMKSSVSAAKNLMENQ